MVLQSTPNRSASVRQQLQDWKITQFEYLPSNGFVFKATDSQIAILRAKPFTRYIGNYEPAYKLSPELGTRHFVSAERNQLQNLGIMDMVVTLHIGERPDDVRTGAQITSVDASGPRFLIQIRGTYFDAVMLAKQDSVAFIEQVSEAVLRNDVTKWVIQTNQTNNTAIWERDIIGQNLIAGLIDSKMYMGHNAFRDDINNTAGPNHRKVVMYNSSSGQTGGDGHGTHTAGTLAGDRQPVDGQTFRNGMAYRARIAFTNLSDVGGSNLYAKLVTAYAAGARDHSNSWGDDGTRQYTSWCQQIDQFSWDYEDATVGFAVSNGSISTTPENAKSCLAVGATQQAPNQELHGSGGSGPTSDGRRKPEIYAPGVNIWSAQSGTTNGYIAFTGTSMACPAVVGGCLLIRQWMRNGYFVNGLSQGPAYVAPVTGSLIRALAINGTSDMTGISGYPSNREGWGRMILDNVLWFAGESRRTIPWSLRNSNGLLQGEQRVFRFQVLDSGTPLKISMSFTDFPGAVFASDPVVNNVDLEVVAPDGTLYLGNVFSGGQSVTGGTADTKNSTEMVLLNAPQTGTWQIRARVTTLNNGGRQGFAVVANGNINRTPGG